MSRLPIKNLKSLIFFPVLLLGHNLFARTEFSLMTYNVENLFDDQHDIGKDDETYLPLSKKQSKAHKDKCRQISNFKFRKDCYALDWNQNVIRSKMKNISDVILSVEQGRGPDILILAEVENLSVLLQLNEHFLKSAGYKTVQSIEGNDPRGIDVAVLSRYELDGKPELLSLELSRPTRGILKVPLKMNGQKLTVFAVHFPSQGSPTEVRKEALNHLSTVLKKEKGPWVAGGDFNITKEEDEEFHLIENYLLPLADVSHLIGCQSCQGTHNYKRKWSFLDLLLFDRRLKKFSMGVDTSSIKVVKLASMLGKKDKPKRFDPDKGQGASDHLPLYSRLFVQKSSK
jgi:endonuclease/exonuclease/phosphatase family metal-dependent hydrolase